MAFLTEQPAYSYRTDPDVPDFDDSSSLAVMDGECALCTFGAKAIDRLDRMETIRICPHQSGLGGALLKHYGLDVLDPESWLFVVDGKAHASFDAMIEVGLRTGGWGRLLVALRIVPRPLRNWLYRRIARNRYTLFGQKDMCAVASPSLRARLMA